MKKKKGGLLPATAKGAAVSQLELQIQAVSLPLPVQSLERLGT